MREHRRPKRRETYLYLTRVPKSDIEKRHMAQHGHIAVDQKHDRRPRMRSCAPENVDLRRQCEEVIVVENDLVHISEHLPERDESERTVSHERGSTADPEPERAQHKVDDSETTCQTTRRVHVPIWLT